MRSRSGSGIAWLKAIEVPVHTGYRARMLEYTLENADASAVVLAPEFEERFEGLGAGLPFVQQAEGEPATDLEGPAPYDISSILYTSGTTGPSKGVMVPWAQAHATATGCIPLDDLTEEDAWYSPYPLFHASGKIPVYAMALINGRVVVRERFSGSEFWRDIVNFRCTTTMMIGASAGYIADRKRREGVTDSPLRNVLVSPPPADPQAFEQEIGIRICSVFNMTEISAPISSEWRPMHNRTCGQRARRATSAGSSTRTTEALGPNTKGELIVRADEPWVLMAGYWRMPEKTAEAWRNGWFHTGDICSYDDDGEFYFHRPRQGRDPPPRREHLLDGGRGGRDRAPRRRRVRGRSACPPSSARRRSRSRSWSPRRRSSTRAELIEFLVPRLPRFMVPRYVEVLEALPRTSTEKMQKQSLREAGITDATWDRETAGVTV